MSINIDFIKENNRTFENKVNLKLTGPPRPFLNIKQECKSKNKAFTRSFKSEMYNKKKWLCGCERLNAFFCFPCIIFGGESIWTETVVVALVFAEDELPLAEPCDAEKCKLPACRCSSTEIPGGLDPRDTPQFVLLTFDDGVNINNIETYRSLIYNRKNKNDCPAGTTFFVSHEYTDYSLVNELYNEGFEIALHSISHKTDDVYWRTASHETLMREFGDQISLTSHFANIPESEIFGIRSPFLQLSGNSSFQVVSTAGLKYDSSWPTIAYTDPGLWPYTLEYQSTQDCIIPPCPTASIPGSWVIPMVAWSDLQGLPCTFVDACFFNPGDDEEAWFQFIIENFERHYLGNRAPFGYYVHEAFFRRSDAARRALARFLDMINNLNDVFMVNANEVINWVQNPIPINEYVKKDCPRRMPSDCRATSCGPLSSNHTEMQYWMRICNRCPRSYPWVGNPLGNL